MQALTCQQQASKYLLPFDSLQNIKNSHSSIQLAARHVVLQHLQQKDLIVFSTIVFEQPNGLKGALWTVEVFIVCRTNLMHPCS